jgi:hypothetical protein
MDNCHTADNLGFAAKGLSIRQIGLLGGYLLNRRHGRASLRKMSREDIDQFSEVGAHRYASDLTEVLKRFDATFPESAGAA